VMRALMPGWVVVAAKAGVAAPSADTEAPVRRTIRREKLVIIYSPVLPAVKRPTRRALLRSRGNTVTIAHCDTETASPSSPTEQEALANDGLIIPPSRKGQTKLTGNPNLHWHQTVKDHERAGTVTLRKAWFMPRPLIADLSDPIDGGLKLHYPSGRSALRVGRTICCIAPLSSRRRWAAIRPPNKMLLRAR
jgi:hypothetical protein